MELLIWRSLDFRESQIGYESDNDNSKVIILSIQSDFFLQERINYL